MKNIYRFIVLLGFLLAYGAIVQGQNVEDGYLREMPMCNFDGGLDIANIQLISLLKQV